MDDKEIIKLFWSRDEQAIAETDSKYHRSCSKIAMNILNNSEDTEECVNDTWLRAWEAIPPAYPNALGAFLAKIVRNLALDKRKFAGAVKRGKSEVQLVIDELEECLAGKDTVEDLILARELGTIVNDFVARLPEREGNVFVRRYFFTETIEEIAAGYELSVNNVSVILNRTRKKLKSRLQKEGY